ncbi:MAG TPA: GDSL-type esterase/lipase family protein [Planctomycetota bacterium]|nr:GDSL-type esterase/lipase family protein [Planctomycetota bacterium]
MSGPPRGRRRLVRGLVAISLPIGAALLLEGALRLAGFGASYLRWDRNTRWSLEPGWRGPGPDLPLVPLAYALRVNARGFRGGEIAPERRPGILRIAALGDSVTFGFGVREEDAFPAVAAARLASEGGGREIEAVNAGVPGFTSLQGLRHLESRVLPLRPDLVTVLFGWNDGWRTAVPDAAWIGRLGGWRSLAESSRAFALGRRGLGFLRRRLGSPSAAPPRPTLPRVPPGEFEANLRAIAEAARRSRAEALLLTLPASFGPDRPPDAYFREDWTVPRGELEPLRLRYAEAARRAAEATGALLVDCAVEVPSDPRLFFEDGYHPNAAGHRAIAERIVEAIRRSGKLGAAAQRGGSSNR